MPSLQNLIKSKFIFRSIFFIDYLSLFFSYVLSYFFVYHTVLNIFNASHLAYFCLSFSMPAAFWYLGVYKALTRYIGKHILVLLAKVVLVYILCATLMLLMVGQLGDFDLVFLQSIFFLILALVSRIGIASYVPSFVGYGVSQLEKKNILIYGAGVAGMQLTAVLPKKQGYEIKGFLDDDESLGGRAIDRMPIFHPKDLERLIKDLRIDEIYLAIPMASSRQYREILARLSSLEVKISTLPKLSDIPAGKVSYKDIKKVNIEDLLLRSAVEPNENLLTHNVSGKVILVTGAGGSVGGEICRQIIKLRAKKILMLDSSEYSLFLIFNELKKYQSIHKTDAEIVPILGSVAFASEIDSIINTWRPETVFHAAAYKHVTMVESNLTSGVRNNVWGTLFTAIAAKKYAVKNFILISTDKAVRPTSAMGASKRISEMVLQAMTFDGKRVEGGTCFSMVRFGNVLGSSGSVVPLFQKQINEGGPITLSHNDVTRYFMTMHEAAQLVIQASSLAKGGDVFLLDMGEPVKIRDLAEKMILLSGLHLKNEIHSDGDIEIVVTGLAPGEKLYEEMLIRNAPLKTAHSKIMRAEEDFIELENLELGLKELEYALQTSDPETIKTALKKLVQDYAPSKLDGDYLQAEVTA